MPPPATEVINVNALTSDGRVSNGYELDDEDPVPDIDSENCDEPSGGGVSPGTYACGSSAFSADACWRDADGDLVCIDRPWDRKLYRRPMAGELPQTPAAEDPQPLGLQLEDGSRYRQRNGTGVGVSPGDLNDVYYCVEGPCGDDPSKIIVVFDAIDEPTVNTTDDAWTVLVGQMLHDGSDDPSTLPEPKTRRVVRAWFITAK